MAEEFENEGAPLPPDPADADAPEIAAVPPAKGAENEESGAGKGADGAPEGENGAPAGDEDPTLSAFEAWAAADPEGAEEYLKLRETQQAAEEAAKTAKPEDEEPAVSIEDQSAEELAQFRRYERAHKAEVEEINSGYNADLNEWKGRAQELAEMKREGHFREDDPIHRQTEAAVQRDKEQLTRYYNEVVLPKNQGVKMYRQIHEEVADDPRLLGPHLMTYALLRANGTLKGTETRQQIQGAINAELAKAGKPLIGQSAKTRKTEEAARRERYAKLKINAGKSGDRGTARAGAAAGAASAGKGAPSIKTTGDATLDAALRDQAKG